MKEVTWIDFKESGDSTFDELATIPLRIISWNILGDGLKLSLSAKHDYCPRDLRVWKKDVNDPTVPGTNGRCERTAEKLLALNADIMCLQECLPHMFDDLCDNSRLKEEYVGFHMKNFLVDTIQDLLSDEMRKKTSNGKDISSSASPSATTASASPAGQGEYGNAIFLRQSLISSGSVAVHGVKSGLFQTLGPQLPSTGSSKVTGKVRKRLVMLDCYGFLIMKLRTVPNQNVKQTPASKATPVDVLVICTHLFWNPTDPHVKALQAEILAQVANICARGKLPPDSSKEASSKKGKKRHTEHNTTNDISNDETKKMREEQDYTSNSCARSNPCLVLICGDFNSIPVFQPEFLTTEDEIKRLAELCKNGGATEPLSIVHKPRILSNEAKLNVPIDRLPYSFQQSAVFRLLTQGSLESSHPEHPDTFGRGNVVSSSKKKMKLCGPLFVDPFVTDPPVGFRMAYGFPDHMFSRNGVHWTVPRTDIKNVWPDLTTKVTDFEGVIDYIFWNLVAEGSTDAENNAQTDASVKDLIVEAGVLRVPKLCGPIPDECHTSDHFPIGMSMRIRRQLDI